MSAVFPRPRSWLEWQAEIRVSIYVLLAAHCFPTAASHSGSASTLSHFWCAKSQIFTMQCLIRPNSPGGVCCVHSISAGPDRPHPGLRERPYPEFISLFVLCPSMRLGVGCIQATSSCREDKTELFMLAPLKQCELSIPWEWRR